MGGLDYPVPVPPNQPRNPVEGFSDRAVELPKRGRGVTHKAVEESTAAAYNQWRSLMRLGRKRYGEECILESLYREYYQAVSDYVQRWQRAKDEVGRRYAADKARWKEGGKGKVGVAEAELI